VLPVDNALHSAVTRRRTVPLVRRTAIPALLAVAALLAGCSGGSHAVSSSTTTADQADAVNQLLAIGIKQAEGKQFVQAQTTFQDLLGLDPGNEYAWYNLGLIAQTENNPKTAISDYQQALKTNPRYTSAMYNEAIALGPTDRQEALSLYKQIVAINPKAATAYLQLSFLYEQMGDHTAAVAARSKATTLDPQLGSVSPPTT
jgi:Tfp pilus assembly protein PilF